MEAATAAPVSQAAPPPRLREKYENEVLPALIEKFGYSTPMEAPRLQKITLNMGLGKEKQDARSFELAHEQLTIIAGQYPNIRKARKSIAAFKLREGMPVGVSATLRRARMWEFLDRLTSIAVPRIRDFRGLNPRSFDGRGNYSMGVKEQLIFPEIDYDSVDIVRGLDVTMTTTAKTDVEAFELLLMLGMPFAQSGRPGQAEREAKEKAAEEEREHEEARLKAETEQAAREELKEENPEAYARPEAEDSADESAAEGGDSAAEES
jgi:large subunit ribosomal protein L5